MSLALQLHLVMMNKYSKFGLDIFYTFWVTLKFLHDDDGKNVEDDNDNELTITIARLFLRNRQANNKNNYPFFFVISNISVNKKICLVFLLGFELLKILRLPASLIIFVTAPCFTKNLDVEIKGIFVIFWKKVNNK